MLLHNPRRQIDPAPFSGFCPLNQILNPVRLDNLELLGHFNNKIKSQKQKQTAEHAVWTQSMQEGIFLSALHSMMSVWVFDGSTTNKTSRPQLTTAVSQNEEVLKEVYLADPWCLPPDIWQHRQIPRIVRFLYFCLRHKARKKKALWRFFWYKSAFFFDFVQHTQA